MRATETVTEKSASKNLSLASWETLWWICKDIILCKYCR